MLSEVKFRNVYIYVLKDWKCENPFISWHLTHTQKLVVDNFTQKNNRGEIQKVNKRCKFTHGNDNINMEKKNDFVNLDLVRVSQPQVDKKKSYKKLKMSPIFFSFVFFPSKYSKVLT